MKRSFFNAIRPAVCWITLMGAAANMPAATTYIWPELPLSATPPCNSTLQACINGTSAGDTVLIQGAVHDLVDRYSSVVINEDLTITHALTLRGDTGVDAVFSTGHSIYFYSPASGDVSSTLDHVTMYAGSIEMLDNSSTASTFTIQNVRMLELAPTVACAIDVTGHGTTLQTINIGSNTLEFHHSYTAVSTGGICTLGASGTMNANIYNNHIRTDNASLFAGIVQNRGLTTGTAVISGNTVIGSGFDWGIAVVPPGPGSTAVDTVYIHDNWIEGQSGQHTQGGALFIHPISTDLHVTNNTLIHNLYGLDVPNEGAGTTLTGRIANNLIAFNDTGISLATVYAGTVSNANNLVYGNGDNVYTPGPGTVTTDPQITSFNDGRLRSTSPAIDAGNNADVPLFSSDADAEPRIANGVVDIGAFEYRGQQTVVHTANAGNTLANFSDVALENVDTGSLLLATPHHDTAISTVEATQNVGVFFSGDFGAPWAVFYENTGVTITAGRKFSVTQIGFGDARFLHASSLANDTAQFSLMNNPTLPSLGGLVLGVTHNYNPGGVGGTYDDERLGFTFQSGHWYLENQNIADDFQAGRCFNVLVEPALALNAFKATVGAAPAARLMLQHPLLDNNNCAAPQVFRDSATVVDDVALSVDYQRGNSGVPGHWYVVAEGSAAEFPAGATFNVIVDGAQANACRDDEIFADGFDG